MSLSSHAQNLLRHLYRSVLKAMRLAEWSRTHATGFHTEKSWNRPAKTSRQPSSYLMEALEQRALMNSAPVLDAIPDLTGTEGSAVNLTATFADPDTGDAHACTVDWGDNTALTNATVTEQDGAGTIAAAHTYATYGSYNVLVALTDNSGDSQTDHATASPVALIDDVAPTLTISGDSSVDEGTTYTLNLSASDPGTETINHWHINWGDNSDRDGDGVAGEIVQGNPSSVTHVYHKSSSAFQISATATDDSGTYSADSMAVAVAPLTVSEPGIVVHVDDGEAIAGTNLVSYTVHLVADSAADAAMAWDGEFSGPLHQVWGTDLDYGPTPASLSSISRPDRLKDTHFLVTPSMAPEPAQEDMLGQYTVTIDPDGIPDSWDEYDANAITEGTGSSLSGAFAFQTAVDRTFAQIVVESGQQVEMTGKVGNKYGEGWLTEITIGGSQQGQNSPQRVQEDAPQGQDSQSNSPAGQTGQDSSAPESVFIENEGQWADSSALFALMGQSADVLMTDSGLELDLHAQQLASGQENLPPEQRTYTTVTAELTAGFVGANSVTPVGVDQVSTIYNYFVGDQSTWRQDVPGFHTVEYQGLYDGINLDISGRDDALKYEFHVAPGADYSQIAVHCDGASGLTLDSQGALHIQTALGDVVDSAPYIYQVVNGQQQQVAGAFTLVDASTYSFTVTGQYDVTKPLVIDPRVVPEWSRFLVESGDGAVGETSFGYGFGPASTGEAIVVDSNDNSLVTGYVTTQKAGSTHTDADVYVSKIGKDGQSIWKTFFGGNGTDIGYGIAVQQDSYHEYVWVTGYTQSTDNFVGHNRYEWYGQVQGDAFVALLDGNNNGHGFAANGAVMPTCFGGGFEDAGYAIAVDRDGVAWITGQTDSYGPDDPRLQYGPLGGGFAQGGPGAFIVRAGRDPSTQALTVDTDTAICLGGGQGGGGGHIAPGWFGGSETAKGLGITFDQSGNTLVAGTASKQFNYSVITCQDCEAFASSIYYQPQDLLHAKASLEVSWLTYVASEFENESGQHYATVAYGIAVDAQDNALIAGYAVDGSAGNQGYHAFVAELANYQHTPTGKQPGDVVWTSTTVTPTNNMGYVAYSLAVDAYGNAVVAGRAVGGGGGAMVTTFDVNSQTWGTQTILGGSYAYGIALSQQDPTHYAYVAGGTFSALSKAAGTVKNQMFGDGDGFVSRVHLYSPIPGDANLDGMVDVLDLGMLATNWYPEYRYTNSDVNRDDVIDWRDQYARGDFNLDDQVDVLDLGILATNWQVGVPTS